MVDPEAELDLYHLLGSEGFECGVEDPDFDEPLDATIALEHSLLHEHSLRLECGDPSRDLTEKLSRIVVAPREGVCDGHGIAIFLIESSGSGAGTELRVLVIKDQLERDCLLNVVRRLKEDSKAYRVSKPGCFSGCFAKREKKKLLMPMAPLNSGPSGEMESEFGIRLTQDPYGNPYASDSSTLGQSPTGSKKKGMSALRLWKLGRHKEESDFDLNEVKEHARIMWDAYAAAKCPGGRRSTQSGMSALSRPSLLRRKNSKLPMEHERSQSQHTGNSGEMNSEESMPSTASPSVIMSNDNVLDATNCTILLLKLLHSGGDDMETPPAGHLLFEGMCSEEDDKINFEDFWSVCHMMLLPEALGTEPTLQKKYFSKSGNSLVVTLQKFEWFLVQVQEANTPTVEEAKVLFAHLQEPEKDASGNMTLYGLSRYLCSERNSLFDPDRCKIWQDMDRPLSDYWIATTHHMYVDPQKAEEQRLSMHSTGSRQFGGSLYTGSECGGLLEGSQAELEEVAKEKWYLLGTITGAIHAGSRCLSLVLAVGSGKRGSDEQLHVLLQDERMPLGDVLEIIEDQAFQNDPAFPLLLVLSLALLTPAAALQVPQVLYDSLGDRLWPNTQDPAPPSPSDARGKMVVVLAPISGVGDVFSDLSARLKPPASLKSQKDQIKPGRDTIQPDTSTPVIKWANRKGAPVPVDSDTELLEQWQKSARDFAIWPGCMFDPGFGNRSPHEIAVGFLAIDELQALEERKLQQLIEYHRRYLTLSYPVALRQAPTNSNPACAWSTGVQMAAVVLRGNGGSAMMAHAGRFAQDNGGCGYVLKPRHLRSETQEEEVPAGRSSRRSQDVPTEREDFTLKVELRIVAARATVPLTAGGHLSVAVSVWGATSDCRRETSRPVSTQCPWAPTAHGGHVVEWPELKTEPMTFVVKSPSTAILVFEVSEVDLRSGKSHGVGNYAAPLNGCRAGIRWVPLWSPGTMEASPTVFGSLAGLLVHVVQTKMKRSGSANKNEDFK